LLSGEAATIQANQTTRVSCEGGSNGGGGDAVDCPGALNGLKFLVNACISGGAYNKAQCMDKYWPNFKSNNPGCAYSAISVCVEACVSGGAYNSAQCADRCMK
jgi:hypothetical protein